VNNDRVSHTVIRNYSDATALFAELVKAKDDIQPLLEGIPGFIRYGLFTNATGGFTVTTCETVEGTTASISIAADWIKDNIKDLTGTVPQIIEGDIAFGFGTFPEATS
jgi:hypothetical protein